MINLQESQSANETELEVIDDDSSITSPVTQQIANIQNNFHFTQNIDLAKVTQLAEVSPDLADRYMTLCEKRQIQTENIDTFIMTTETKEQNSRISEKPYQRKFAFRSLNYALIISLSSLAFAAYCAHLGHTKLAIVGITIPISIAVANMLGSKSATQKKNDSSESDSVEKQNS